jgi:predicted permease
VVSLVDSIAPVFLVIVLGWLLGRRGLLGDDFTSPANRVVFTVGVPALVFREVARADFARSFDPTVILLTLGAVAVSWCLAWAGAAWAGLPAGTRGTFLQAAVHGNTSYIGLAMVLYSLGQEGLGRAGVLSGFLILLNNGLSVLSLARWGRGGVHRSTRDLLGETFLNPVVLGSVLGLAASWAGLRLPVFIDRSLSIVGSMALPLALLVMGAGLSLRELAGDVPRASAATLVKLAVLPGIALALYRLAGIPRELALPPLLLLAAPTATLTYVMAREMDGDPHLAGGAIGLSTLASAFTYLLWFRVG